MLHQKILIIEDDPKTIVFLEDQLNNLGYRVEVAYNGKKGLEMVEKIRPDLIVLDVMMPELDGYEVCRHLKTNPETKTIPILMLTAKWQVHDRTQGKQLGADAYMPKPYDKREFEVTIEQLLKKSKRLPFSTSNPPSYFTITLQNQHPIAIRISGSLQLSGESDQLLRIQPERYARKADNAFSADWRFNSKDIGEELFEKIFQNHPRISDAFGQAKSSVEKKEQLHLRIAVKKDFLRVPFEFTFDKVYGNGDYLALTYPLSRYIINTPTRKKTLSPAWFNQLFEANETLRILLIASNTHPDIPSVDEEVRLLSESLQAIFEERRINTEVDSIWTHEATAERITQVLRHCPYHIIHYAGHGIHHASSPEKSALFFWEKTDKGGDVLPMPVTRLQRLLNNAKTSFFYLSCCQGTTTSGDNQLLDDDFIGIADGLIHAQIPAVLGYRWPVSDAGAATLALAFYRSLAAQGHLDRALLEARNEIAGLDRDDITWLSPILVVQE